MLERTPKSFTTSAISPTEFSKAYRELSTQVESILCITMDSKTSAVFSMAKLAKGQVEGELPHTTIEVLDSRTVASSQGLVVLAAVRAAVEGNNITEVIAAAEKVRDKVNFVAVMETIRYVHRTGRVSKTAVRLGSMLHIKPIFTFSQGAVRPVTIARNKQHGINRALKLMRDKAKTSPIHVSVVHTGMPEEGERLMERISSEFDCVELWLTEFSPVMAYSTGPGVLGFAFYAED
jgi:DegV family protein with EDD domain